VYFAGGGFMPCDDDEDICDFGSGDSDSSIFTPSEHDSKFFRFSSLLPENHEFIP